MTKNDPGTGDHTPRHLEAQAERQLAAYGAELDAAIDRLRGGDETVSRDFATLAASLRKALEAVFSERAKLDRIDQLEGQRRGGQAGGELDLDAARAEVRGRMARLRAAQRAGGLSGQPE